MKIRNYHLFVYLGVLITSAVAFPYSAYAGTVLFSGNNICQYIGSIYTFGTSAVGILSVLMIMIGGGFYLYSAGNEERAGMGKEMITGAIAGLVLMFLTILFFNTLAPNILNCRAIGSGTNLTSNTNQSLNNSAPALKPGEFRNVTTFRQNSGELASTRYAAANCSYDSPSKGTYKSAGCGPTAMAMALSGYGVNVSPKDVGDHMVDNGWRKCAGGTAGAGITNGFNKWGYQGQITKSFDSAKKAAGEGYMVVALARGKNASKKHPDTRSYFTNGGHYILLSATICFISSTP